RPAGGRLPRRDRLFPARRAPFRRADAGDGSAGGFLRVARRGAPAAAAPRRAYGGGVARGRAVGGRDLRSHWMGNHARPMTRGRPPRAGRVRRGDSSDRWAPAHRPARRGTGSGLGNLAAVGEPQTGNSLQGVQLVDAIDAKQGDDPTLRCQQCPLQREDYVIIDDLAASMLTTSRILLGATDGGPQHFFAHLLVFGLY